MLSVIFHFHKSLLLSHVIFLDEILLEYRKMRWGKDFLGWRGSFYYVVNNDDVRQRIFYDEAVGVAENFLIRLFLIKLIYRGNGRRYKKTLFFNEKSSCHFTTTLSVIYYMKNSLCNSSAATKWLICAQLPLREALIKKFLLVIVYLHFYTRSFCQHHARQAWASMTHHFYHIPVQ